MFSLVCLSCSWKRSCDPIQDKEEREDPWEALRAEPGTVNRQSILGVIIFIIITILILIKTSPSLFSLPPLPSVPPVVSWGWFVPDHKS